jgi:hypothetical protein
VRTIRFFGVNLFRPIVVSKRVSATIRRRIASVEEILGAVALGNDPLQLFAFGLFRAALRACHVTINDSVIVEPLHSCKARRWKDFLLSLAPAQLFCQFGFCHFSPPPFAAITSSFPSICFRYFGHRLTRVGRFDYRKDVNAYQRQLSADGKFRLSTTGRFLIGGSFTGNHKNKQ